MRRSHAMPFGAELSADGVARFRLWAPAAKRVEIDFPRGDELRTLAMARGNDGALAMAPSSDSGLKELSSGGTAWPAHSFAASWATRSPVSRSRFGEGLISMLSAWWLRRQKAAMAAKLARGSPAKARLCHLPASS